jgi:hypothetical protein
MRTLTNCMCAILVTPASLQITDGNYTTAAALFAAAVGAYVARHLFPLPGCGGGR